MCVLIGLCNYGSIDAQFFNSFLQMDKPEDWSYVQIIRTNTPLARNLIVQNALKDNSVSHVFFMDDDMIFPKDTLTRLLAHDAAIVSGFYVKRVPPFYPINARRVEGLHEYETIPEYHAGLQEVDVAGGGCLLIKRGVLEALQNPWFAYHSDWMGKETTEDVVFCEHAKDAGYTILLDFDVKCLHMASIPVGYEHWEMSYKSLPKPRKRRKKVA